MERDSDAAQLKALLRQLEDVWRAAGDPAVDLLAPGLSEKDTTDLFASIGLTPTPELQAWFGWHNGATGEYVVAIPPAPQLVPLATAIEDFRMWRGLAKEVHADF